MPPYFPGYPYPYLAQSYVSLSNLSPGDFVIMDKVDATTIKVKKDLVDPYNLIGGFVVDTCPIGGTVKVYPLNVVNNALAGLVIGNTYYADPLVAGGITNVGTTARSSTLKQVCSTVLSEGGYELRGAQSAIGTPVASPRDLTVISTEYPVISIRLKSTRLDAIVILTALSIMGITNNSNYNWKVITGGTTTGGSWDTTGARINATYADLAERYAADASYSAGTVVEIGGEKEITIVKDDLSENVFGVISNTAAYMMNSTAGDDSTHPAVALAGRVKVRAIGIITKGQRLVSAGNGIARGAKLEELTPFNTIGRALQDKMTEEEGIVEAIVVIK